MNFFIIEISDVARGRVGDIDLLIVQRPIFFLEEKIFIDRPEPVRGNVGV